MPTPVLIDGFEHKITSTNSFSGTYNGVWESFNGSPTYAAGRTGQCLQVAAAAASVGAAKRVNDLSICVVSFYFRRVSQTGSTSIFMATTIPFSGACRIYMDGSGSQLGVQVGGVGPVSEGPAMNDGAWHRVDLKIDTSTSTWSVVWAIDGTPMTTVNGGGHSVDAVRYLTFGTIDAATVTMQYDDLVVSGTAGDYPLGVHDVLYGVPTGDGTHSAGVNTIEDNAGTDITSPNAFPLLDEAPPTVTDYIQQSTIGASNYAEVTFDDQPGSKTIWGVEGTAALFSSGVNANNGTTRIVDSAGNTLTDIYAGDMSETALHYRRAIITAPGGGWDDAGYQGVKARVGFASDVTDVPRWAALMLQYAVVDALAAGGDSFDPMGMTGFFGA